MIYCQNENIFPKMGISYTIVHLEADFLKTTNCNPAGNYMFKVNNRNTRSMCEICSNLTIKTPK